MQYICDVTGNRIPKNKTVNISLTPKKTEELEEALTDWSEKRTHINKSLMVSQEVAETLINMIKNGTLNTILNIWPPLPNGKLALSEKSVNQAIELSKLRIDDPNNHKNHRFPIGGCQPCKDEQYDDVTANDFDENGEFISEIENQAV